MFRIEISICAVLLSSYFNALFAYIIILDKGVMPLVKDSVGIQFYVEVQNKNRRSGCTVNSKTKTCLIDENKRDCKILETSSDFVYLIKPKKKRALIFVLPTLFQHDLIGYVDVTLDHRCRKIRNTTKLHIPFNTKVPSRIMPTNYLLRDYIRNENLKECKELDLNSLKDCVPADCDVKYLGKRSYYNKQLQRCTEVTTCIGDPDKELPEAALVVISNTCRDLDSPLTVQDIYAIRTGLGTAVVSTTESSETDKIILSSNCTTISQNIKFIRDLAYGRLNPSTEETIDVSVYCKSAFFSIAISVMIFCAIILFLAFCLNTVCSLCKNDTTNEGGYWKKIKNTLNVCEIENVNNDYAENKEVRNSLIREIMIRDLPLELRNSAVDICQVMREEIRNKKRYRLSDVGSQISLNVDNGYHTTTASGSSASIEENDNKNRLPY